MKLIIRWLVVAIAVAVAAWLIPGIRIEGTNAVIAVIVFAAVLGLVNAIVRPILALLSCGCIAATLGLFMLVVNGVAFWLASVFAKWLGVGFYVDNLLAAILGGIVVGVVSFVLSIFLPDKKED